MARLLREHPPVARAPRFGSHAGLGRPDRRSADGSTHRERPVPRRAARTRPTARPSAQPSLLGTSPSLRRAARDPICAVGFRSRRRGGERRLRRRLRSTSGGPGRSSAAGDAVGRVRKQPTSSSSPSSSDRTLHPALRDKLVRRALAYGIDRTALVRQILGDPLRSRTRQRRAPAPEPRTTSRTGARTVIDRRRPVACSGKPAAAEERTGSFPAAESGSRCGS